MQKDSGTVREYYDQGYIDDLAAGNLSATHGVVGRRPLLQDLGGLRRSSSSSPRTGALLWIDNMLIPVGAANPQGAYS